jgi:hypothetical protein
MAKNSGSTTVESPQPKETVSEVQASVEQQPIPEQAQETVEVGQESESPVESAEQQEVQELQDVPQVADAPATTPAAAPAQDASLESDRLLTEINLVLEEDLTDMYLAMTPEKQKEFKEKGEVTVTKIRQIVSEAKVNAKKVFHLIRAWLKIIPGVNRFFLEQEAKIKTDKILLITEEEKKRQQNGL